MASKSTASYAQRAATHSNALVKRLFGIAERKQTNIVLSADLTTTKDLLAIADSKSSTQSQTSKRESARPQRHHPPVK